MVSGVKREAWTAMNSARSSATSCADIEDNRRSKPRGSGRGGGLIWPCSCSAVGGLEGGDSSFSCANSSSDNLSPIEQLIYILVGGNTGSFPLRDVGRGGGGRGALSTFERIWPLWRSFPAAISRRRLFRISCGNAARICFFNCVVVVSEGFGMLIGRSSWRVVKRIVRWNDDSKEEGARFIAARSHCCGESRCK